MDKLLEKANEAFENEERTYYLVKPAYESWQVLEEFRNVKEVTDYLISNDDDRSLARCVITDGIDSSANVCIPLHNGKGHAIPNSCISYVRTSLEENIDMISEYIKYGDTLDFDMLKAKAYETAGIQGFIGNSKLYNELEQIYMKIFELGYYPDELVSVLYVYSYDRLGEVELEDTLKELVKILNFKTSAWGKEYNTKYSVWFTERWIEFYVRNTHLNCELHIIANKL